MEIRNILKDKMAIDFLGKVQGSAFKVPGFARVFKNSDVQKDGSKSAVR